MFQGDKGKRSKFQNIRINYDVYNKNEKATLKKLDSGLNFFSLSPSGKVQEIEIIYDTDNKLFTESGLIISKKIMPTRCYFRISRMNIIKGITQTESKYFLGECDMPDQPSDFPTQIADGISKILPELFAVDLVTLVKHLKPYIKIEIYGESYKLSSGNGYSATLSYETQKYTNLQYSKQRQSHARKNMQKRVFSVEMPNDPQHQVELKQIIDAIEKHCKELVPYKKNRFEIAKTLLFPKINASLQKVTAKQIKEEQKNAKDSQIQE